jgi:hypothetical protein
LEVNDKMRIKKLKKIIIALVTTVILLAPTTALAHSLFYNAGLYREFYWKWETSETNQAYLKCNNDYISGAFENNYSDALSAWNASGIQCYAIDHDFSGSKVDFCTPTSTWWQNNMSPYVIGVCYLTNEDGEQLNELTLSQLETCNNMIRYAGVYLNPDFDDSEAWEKKILVHEMGHVMGLGHPPTSFSPNSIMKQGELSYSTPQTHDIDDVNAKYPDD